MKVRIGVSLGPLGDDETFADAVEALEVHGIDSLWLSEVVYADTVEPFVGMAYALARTKRLKVGTGVAVLPGRHPVLVAKQLASLAALAPGRVLPVFGLQPARSRERPLFPAPPGRRGALFDESLRFLRRMLTEPVVDFRGEFFEASGASVGRLPAQPLDIWLGGSGPVALRRVGELADGWLASLVAPEEAAAGRVTIERAAAAAGRVVDPEHFGISLPVSFGGLPEDFLALALARRPDVDPARLVPVGWDGARDRIAEYVEAGLSKFVVRPLGTSIPWQRFLDEFAAELKPVQT